MSVYKASFLLNLEKNTDKYYKLLKEEDYDFKTKQISMEILKKSKSELIVELSAKTLIELKIASSALIKSLEIIEKTLNV